MGSVETNCVGSTKNLLLPRGYKPKRKTAFVVWSNESFIYSPVAANPVTTI